MQSPNQRVMIRHRPIPRIDVVIVADVVAHVDLRGAQDGREPDHVDAQLGEVVDLGGDAAEGAGGGTGGSGGGGAEGGGVDLVDGGFFPPGSLDAGWGFGGGGHFEYGIWGI